MRVLFAVALLVAVVVTEEASEKTREKRSARSDGYDRNHRVVEKHTYYVKKEYKKPNQCYQCAYSPPKTYYDQKVFVEEGRYKKQHDGYEGHNDRRGYGDEHRGYGDEHRGYGDEHKGYGDEHRGYGDDHRGYGHDSHGYGKHDGYQGGYTKRTVVDFPFTVIGGWDKCVGPFSKYEAKSQGIDEWDCDSNCYVRRDPNGDVFRGCYKGEHDVNPYKLGCHKQAGSVYCFCEGDKCNNGPSPGHDYGK